jgi:hypothetical protein
LWLSPLLTGVRLLDTLARWSGSRGLAAAQGAVTGNKRKLYGLPPVHPK